jgi:IclR family transcriptional regulator, KDG regulon repressor
MGTETVHRSGRATSAVLRQPPRAPVRSMQAIQILATAREGLTLAALSAALKLPKTSLLHLLQALEAAHYVKREKGVFQLGAGSRQLAALIGTGDGFPSASREVMHELLEQTRETVLLGRFADGHTAARYFERLPSPQTMRFTPDLHEDRPLYCTAMGKVLLAYAPEAETQAWLKSATFERFTPRTVRSRKALRKELSRVRAQGIALSADEMFEGGAALATPVFDNAGDIRMALVIAAPSARLLPRSAAWAELLKKGAARLSGLLAPLAT